MTTPTSPHSTLSSLSFISSASWSSSDSQQSCLSGASSQQSTYRAQAPTRCLPLESFSPSTPTRQRPSPSSERMRTQSTSSQEQQQQQTKPQDRHEKHASSAVAFVPFPRCSVNIVTGPTFVGKTFFVTQLVNDYKAFFVEPLNRVVVVLCNSRVKSISFSPELDVPVEQVLLSDFSPDFLETNDLVIIDDLQRLTPEVKFTISVCAHHTSLASLFVITHALLGTSNFELLSLCHRILLFLGSTANKRLTSYIFDHFFSGDPEVKTYLRGVLNYCSQQNQVLALELSPVGPAPQVVLAFSHILQLHSRHGDEQTLDGYCLLYPNPHFGSAYSLRFDNPQSAPLDIAVQKNRDAEDDNDDDNGIMSVSFLTGDPMRNLPTNTIVGLPVRYVVDRVKNAAATSTSSSSHECADRESWESTLQDIEDNIESFFPLKRWKVCKNLAKEILSSQQFCITRDGKQFHLTGRPNTKVNLLSFLGLATRKAGPTEKIKKPEWGIYTPHIRQLLANGTPRELFVNALLLQTPRQLRRRKNTAAAAATQQPFARGRRKK